MFKKKPLPGLILLSFISVAQINAAYADQPDNNSDSASASSSPYVSILNSAPEKAQIHSGKLAKVAETQAQDFLFNDATAKHYAPEYEAQYSDAWVGAKSSDRSKLTPEQEADREFLLITGQTVPELKPATKVIAIANASQEKSAAGSIGFLVDEPMVQLDSLRTSATSQTMAIGLMIDQVNDQTVVLNAKNVVANAQLLSKENTAVVSDGYETILSRGINISQRGTGAVTVNLNNVSVSALNEGIQTFAEKGSIKATIDGLESSALNSVKVLSKDDAKNEVTLKGSLDTGKGLVEDGNLVKGYAAYVDGNGAALTIESNKSANKIRGQLIADNNGVLTANFIQGSLTKQISAPLSQAKPADENDENAAREASEPVNDMYATRATKFFESLKKNSAFDWVNGLTVDYPAEDDEDSDTQIKYANSHLRVLPYFSIADEDVPVSRLVNDLQKQEYVANWKRFKDYVNSNKLKTYLVSQQDAAATAEEQKKADEEVKEKAEKIRNLVNTSSFDALRTFVQSMMSAVLEQQAYADEDADPIELDEDSDYGNIVDTMLDTSINKNIPSTDPGITQFLTAAYGDYYGVFSRIYQSANVIASSKESSVTGPVLTEKSELGFFNSDIQAYRGARTTVTFDGLNPDQPVVEGFESEESRLMDRSGRYAYSKHLVAQNEGTVNKVTFTNTDFIGVADASNKGTLEINLSGTNDKVRYANAPLRAAEGGVINATFNNALYEGFTGQVDTDSAINVTLSNAQWNVPTHSQLNNLTLSSGVLNLAQAPSRGNAFVPKPTTPKFALVTLNGTLKADAASRIVLRTNGAEANTTSLELDQLDSDKLIVNAIEGSLVLSLTDLAAEETQDKPALNRELILVKTLDKQGDVKADVVQGLLSKQIYKLKYKPTSEYLPGYGAWYLADFITQLDSDFIEANMSNANSIVNFWRDDWLTMNQRIGEMFNGTDTFPRVWARARQHRLMGTTDYGFDRKSQEVELGYSFYSKREDDLMRYRGISLEGKKLNAMNDKHINSGRSVGVSLYQTDIYDNHFYGDYVLRVNQWRSGTSVTVDNESYDPLWRQWGVSLSGEWGRRFEYDHHWYLEPNTQWVIGYLQGKSWSNDKVQVQTKGTPSLVGRVGFNLGKVSADERKRLYGKFNVYHDFLAKNKMTFTNESMTVDKTVSQRGTWVKVGLGGALTLGKETQLYADVDTTIAGKFSHDLSVNVGLKWKF